MSPVGTKRTFAHRSPDTHAHCRGLENTMKALVSILAIAVALAFTGPAFAGNLASAKTAADCAKASGVWDAKTNICSAKKM
jgi:hypothetical protein